MAFLVSRSPPNTPKQNIQDKVTCGICGTVLSTGSFPRCCRCLKTFHFKCIKPDLAIRTYNSWDKETQRSWECKGCSLIETAVNHKTPVSSKRAVSSPEQDINHQLYKIPKTMTNSEELGNSGDITALSSNLQVITQQLSQLMSQPGAVARIQTDIQTILTENKQLREDLNVTNIKVTALEEANTQYKQRISDLENTLNDNQQYQLKNNLIISNVPINKQNESPEDTLQIVNKLFSSMKIQCAEYDIVATHRLPNKRRRTLTNTREPPTIIVKLHHSQTKSRIISESIKQQPTAAIFDPSNQTRIFFNEHLTKQNRQLFMETRYRLKKQENKVYSVKQRNGQVFVKKTEFTPPIQIKNAGDIDRLFNRDISSL